MFKPTQKQIISFSLFSVFLFFLLSFSAPVNKLLNGALKAPLALASLLRREAGGVIFYHRNLTQNEAINRESDFLRQKINALNEYYYENMRLKNILALKSGSGLRFIAARVIARSPDNWSCGLIIDKGSNQGIRRGMSVVTYLGLAGKVTEAGGFTSKVMLLSDPNLGVSGLIQRSRQEGLVAGTLGNNLMMKYLPEEADIKTGDTVISSGLNDNYPKGILIGRVIEIGREFSGLSRYAIIKPAVNFSNIEELLVVVP